MIVPMRTTAFILTTALLAALGTAIAAGNDAELREAEKAWASAVASHNYAELDRILGEGLIYAHSTGHIESKAQYLGRLHSGAQKYDSIQHSKMTIRPYGDAAVVHSIVRMTGTSDGKPFDDRLMMMHVWVKQEGQWRLAAHQTTKLP